ncbi:hypothetical protein L207DRAFT_344132 [Hyaloscypha variabilis F]|uniref:Uncharacterized protein n=1 Tax=Hyaloscypha variabilis (strain UAMH 11265 / GT02V1 / F) TaxID=1149755 RepID=A0A2J6RQD3_HYAVF|nr:hypothetical protein L207DRAFT_344132 [Hyaloscypha variabilis F]
MRIMKLEAYSFCPFHLQTESAFSCQVVSLRVFFPATSISAARVVFRSSAPVPTHRAHTKWRSTNKPPAKRVAPGQGQGGWSAEQR